MAIFLTVLSSSSSAREGQLVSRFIEDIIEDIDVSLNINNLTATVAVVCDISEPELFKGQTTFALDTCNSSRIYEQKGSFLKPPYQNKGVLCSVTRTVRDSPLRIITGVHFLQ